MCHVGFEGGVARSWVVPRSYMWDNPMEAVVCFNGANEVTGAADW